MSKRRVQSINPNDPQALQKVIEALEVSEGVRGNKGDRKPTIDEVKQMLSGQSGSSSSKFSLSGSLVGGGSVPAKPSEVSIKGLIDSIVIHWTIPEYQGHGATEIYRASTNQLSDAVLIGNTSSSYFIDWTALENQTYHYFIRHKQVFSLGAKTGPYASSVTGSRSPAKAVASLESGVINSTSPASISFGLVEAGRRVLISLQGAFFSTVDYDEVGLALLPETGNAVNVTVSRNGSNIKTAIPVKLQAAHADANGQVKYLYFLQIDIDDTTPAGALSYTLAATKVFPAFVGGFELSYSAQLI